MKRWSDAKGCGFITDETGKDVFVHYMAIRTPGFKTLTEGEAVTFEFTPGPRGPQAANVLREPSLESDGAKSPEQAPQARIEGPRADFGRATKAILAARVGYRCSNPGCRARTSGPQAHPAKAVNVGVGAHITAASPGGPRYESTLAVAQRIEPANGIWLCQNCAKLVDNDPAQFTADVLRAWKATAEIEARTLVGKATVSANDEPRFSAVDATGMAEPRRKVAKPIGEQPFLAALERLVRKPRPSRRLSLGLVDIDGQTLINRRYGREVGNRIIAILITLLQWSTGSRLVGRLGADSFYAVLEGLNVAETHEVMESVCATVRSYEWDRLASGLHVTCSVGVAEWNLAEDVLSWAVRASEAVKTAKRGRGNRVARGPLFLPKNDRRDFWDFS